MGLASLGVASAATAATATVQVATNATFSTILANSSGFALYTLNTDHDGQSTCHGACAAAWPPLNVPAGTVPTGGPGVTGALGTAKQSNGTFQVTYNGSPLYTFVSDAAPGQVTGNGVTGFFVVAVTDDDHHHDRHDPLRHDARQHPAPRPSGAPADGRLVRSCVATAPAAASSGSLAFTGAGPQLRSLVLLGFVLLALGTLATLASARPAR